MSLSHLVFIALGWLLKKPLEHQNAQMQKDAAAHGAVEVQALIPTQTPGGRRCKALCLDVK